MRERHASFLRFSKSATREEKADEGGMGGQERREQIYKNVNQVRHDNGDALAWIIRGETTRNLKPMPARSSRLFVIDRRSRDIIDHGSPELKYRFRLRFIEIIRDRPPSRGNRRAIKIGSARSPIVMADLNLYNGSRLHAAFPSHLSFF